MSSAFEIIELYDPTHMYSAMRNLPALTRDHYSLARRAGPAAAPGSPGRPTQAAHQILLTVPGPGETIHTLSILPQLITRHNT